MIKTSDYSIPLIDPNPVDLEMGEIEPKSCADTSLLQAHYERVGEFQSEQQEKVSDLFIHTVKLSMALSPLLFLNNWMKTTVLSTMLAIPPLAYGSIEAVSYLYGRCQSGTDEEKNITRKKAGQCLRRTLDWGFNPIGNTGAAATLKSLDVVQKKYTQKDSKAWKSIQAIKAPIYYGMRLIAPTLLFFGASIAHNKMVSLEGGNPLSLSREMQQRDPYLFSSSSLCTEVLTWQRAKENVEVEVEQKLSKPRNVTYNYYEMMQATEDFGLSQEEMRYSVQKSLAGWEAHTQLHFIGSEESCGSECSNFDVVFHVDPTIGIASEASKSNLCEGKITSNPNPDTGPRWTDSQVMLSNTLRHEFGHLIGLGHPDEENQGQDLYHYYIMHAGPRWEPAITAVDVPEVDIVTAEKYLGATPDRLPGVEPADRKKFCLEVAYVFWRIREEFSPLKIV